MLNTKTATGKNILGKRKDHAFSKDVYLLGTDKDGIKYWLEAPKWDCGWYWGFGYVETYKGNRAPSAAKDIDSHEHIESSFIGKHEYYSSEKNTWVMSEYIHNIYDSPKLHVTTFSENEGWTLSELFKSFYLLKNAAEFFGKGSAHISNNPVAGILKDEAQAKRINEILIPAVTEQIIKILSPID